MPIIPSPSIYLLDVAKK